jgi:nitrate/nitrite transporter NarK
VGFNAGTNVGALVTSVTVPWLTIQLGWRWAFLIAGGRGLLWVIGVATMAGAVGGMLIAKKVGYILQWTGSYSVIFGIAGSAYPLALVVIQVLAPKLEPVRIEV